MSDLNRSNELSRKELLKCMLLAACSLPAAASAGSASVKVLQRGGQAAPSVDEITLDDLKAVEKIAKIEFTDEERRGLLNSVQQMRRGWDSVRSLPVDNGLESAVLFEPWGVMPTAGARTRLRLSPAAVRSLPAKHEDIAFLSARDLSELIRTKQISPVELTKLYLDRLKEYGEKLLCVVSLTEELAMRQARQAEEEIMAGKWRGPLHGLPYGLKDLFAVPGYPTTWGAQPYEKQMLDVECAVYTKLRDAGAVLVAKLSMGALAMGDVWFKGRTKNPWNPAQGSSGSSAGSACATAAGLVAFAIGTETLGSIVSPSNQCRVTGLRPTFGRVSRYGAMSLTPTMDKVGPLCRTVEDCAMVFAALIGRDERDRVTADFPFEWDPNMKLDRLKIGYTIGASDDPKDRSRIEKDEALSALSKMGAKLEPIRFDPPANGVSAVLGVEASAEFDAFTRGDMIDDLKNSAWPTTFRSNRYFPAVEYLQAQKARHLLQQSFEKQFADFDMVVTNGIGGQTITTTNLTGHPQVLVPNGADGNNSRSVSFVGRLYREDRLLAVARKVQMALGHVGKRPDLTQL